MGIAVLLNEPEAAEVIQTPAPTATPNPTDQHRFDALAERVIVIAEECTRYAEAEKAFTARKQTFRRYFLEHADEICEFRAMFPPAGSHDNRVPVRGKPLSWSEFVDRYFEVSTRYVNGLMQAHTATTLLGAPVPKPPDLEVKHRKWIQLGYQRAQNEMLAKGIEVKATTQAPATTKLTPATQPADTTNWTDNRFIKTCADIVGSTLQPLESDPKRFATVATAIAQEILGKVGRQDNGACVTKPKPNRKALPVQ